MSSRETTSWEKQCLKRSRTAAGNTPAKYSTLFELAIRLFTRYVVHGHPRKSKRQAGASCCSASFPDEAQDFCYHRHRFLWRVVPFAEHHSSSGFRASRPGSLRFGGRADCGG